MKKFLFAYAALAVAALAFTSCSKDEEEEVDTTTTVSAYLLSKEILWASHGESIDQVYSYTKEIFAEELQKLGYYESDDYFYSYSQETTKSQAATVKAELEKKWAAHYTEVLPKIDTYDFSACIPDDIKDNHYSYEYQVKASTYCGVDVSIWLCVCNPQLVKGMTYKAEDAACPVQSITIDNGELNHFTIHKTATVVYADGTTKTESISELGSAFMFKDSDIYGFTYAGEKYTDQSEITLYDTNYVLKLQ